MVCVMTPKSHIVTNFDKGLVNALQTVWTCTKGLKRGVVQYVFIITNSYMNLDVGVSTIPRSEGAGAGAGYF